MQKIAYLTDFITNCGDTENSWHGDDFDSFLRKRITFKNVVYEINALDQESLIEQEIKLIDILMRDFKHVKLIGVRQAIEHANGNNMEIDKNRDDFTFTISE